MRVHHLNCGTMRPFGGRLIDGRRGFLHRAELVCHCLLLETNTGLVLIETGMGSPAVRRPEEWLGRWFVRTTRPVLHERLTAAAQIKALGFTAEDVRHIVLTHLDLDHAGGLVDFPGATVHVYAEELRAFESPTMPPSAIAIAGSSSLITRSSVVTKTRAKPGSASPPFANSVACHRKFC